MKHRIAAGFLAFLTALPLAAQRLPRIVFPVRYDMTITPDLASETFSGQETIAVSVERETSVVELNASDMAFDRVTVTSGETTQTATVTLNADGERASLNLRRPIGIGPATIQISWKGKLNRQLRGFYIGEANGKKYLASQMEAIDARYGFPSFDEPEYKAQFALTVIIDENLKAYSNSAIESESVTAGRKTIRFALTPRMSSYLLALVVGDFDCLSDISDGVPQRVCASPDRVHLGRFALDESKAFMKFFNRYYSIPYPFGKLDHLGLADFAAGAMENIGAITYRESYLVTDPRTTSPTLKKGISTVIAHETAHQWFGDLVTMKWWDDIWLNEGFASWMEYKAVEQTHPEWNVTMDALEETNSPLRADVFSTTRAIHHPVERRDEIDEIFDAIAYSKTAAVLRMVERYAGAEKFREGVNYYIERHAYGNASAGDFAAALSFRSGESAGDVLESFVKQPGLPLLTVDSRCDGDTTIVDVKQERFFVRRDRQAPASDQLWIVPLCTRTGSESQCTLLRERNKTFQLRGCHAPLFANGDGAGYYLTDYAPDDRQALLPRVSALSSPERFVFLRDEWFLTRAGLRSIGQYLDLGEAYADESERATIKELLTNLQTVERYVVTDAQRPQFQAWMRGLIGRTAQKLGWKEADGESDDTRDLRSIVLEFLGDAAADPATRKQARAVALQFVKDPVLVSPAIASNALQLAAIQGDESLFDVYLRAYRSSRSANLRNQLLGGMAAFRSPRLLRRTLELVVSDEVRSQDAARVLLDVLRNRAGSEIGWNFLKQNWEIVYRKIPPGSAGYLIGGIGSTCDLNRRDELRELIKKYNVREAARATATTAEKMTQCVEFRDLQRENLRSWIDRRGRTR